MQIIENAWSVTLFLPKARALKLAFSEKGACVCTDIRVAKLVARSLAKCGITINPVEHSRDVGVSFSGGARKCNQLLKHRFESSASRRARTLKLSSNIKGCSKLFSGSGYNASIWGHQLCGVEGPMLLKLEQHAAAVSGIRKAGRCRFTTNCITYGPRKHPFAQIISDTVRLWFKRLSNYRVQMLSYFRKFRGPGK